MTDRRKLILKVSAAAAVAVLLALGWWVRRHLQTADPNYSARVNHPAYLFKPGLPHPRVFFDAAHHNFHTIDGRYGPFAALLRADGFRVQQNTAPFTEHSFDSMDVLIIANAMGASLPILPGASSQAFTDTEMDAVRDWVLAGGALLLIADHAPMGDANRALAGKFNVDMQSARTVDFMHFDSVSGSPAWIEFLRSRGEIASHPITNGRDSSQRIDKVIAFAGQSIEGPSEATALLVLGDSAYDLMPNGRRKPVTGRAMALAMPFGKGRLVVVGEAAMLTAQVTNAGQLQFGFQLPRSQDARFALNIVEWLAEK
jgi:hypothetical protein